MFDQLTILDAQQHADLRFSANQPYDFARQQILIPVVSSELSHVAREMPVFFPKEGGVPQALVGLPSKGNVHVKESGHWLGRYIPSHIRRYPFILLPLPKSTPEAEQRYAVQFDASARHFELPDGQRLLDEQGQPTPLLIKIEQVLVALMRDDSRTKELVAQLDQQGLLVEKTITLGQGEDAQPITGLRVLDEQALAALDGEALVRLRDSGALALAYAHLLSLSNLKDGLIARAIATDNAAPNIEELFAEGDDDFSFDFDS